MQEEGRAQVTSGAGHPVHPRAVLAATAAGVLAADQAAKCLAAHLLASGRPALAVGGFFDLQLSHNPGGAFGILAGRPLLFVVSTLLIVGAILVWGIRSGRMPVALGLVAGGGAGNLLDRILRAPGGLQGRVVDFIHFHFWPTFNLADSAIVIGVGLLILGELRPQRP